IDGDRRVVPRSLPEEALIVDALPRTAAVVRSEQAAVFRLDQRVDAPAVRGGDRDTDFPPRPFRQPGFVRLELFPGVSPVARDVQPTPRPAGGHVPRFTPSLPQARE